MVRARTVRAVTDLARTRLPAYMVPAGIRALPSLPVGPSGKLDRAALPVSFVDTAQRAAVTPRTDLERELLMLWQDLLGLDDVGVEDDFFRLGGHSLLAVRVLSSVAGTFGVRPSLAAFFAAPTVAGLAAEVERVRDGADDPAEVIGPADLAAARRSRSRLDDADELAGALAGRGRPDPDADVTVVPLSRAQQRMWFLDLLEQGRPVYTVRRAYRVAGPVDVDLLEEALGRLVARHDGLRTLVRQRGEVLAGLVADDAGWPLERVDVSREADPEGAAREHARTIAAQPFDLGLGPLAQAYWYVLDRDDALLVLRLHHILVDAWALDVLVRELQAVYGALVSDGAIRLPAVLQYPDVVVWQEQHDADAVVERDLAYWRERMTGAPAALELPTDRPRPPEPTSAGHRVSLALGTGLTEQVRALAREQRATPFAVLLAATAALLSRLSGQEDVVVGSAVAGRNRAEVEHTVGLFANTLLLRTDTSGDPRFADLVAQCQATVVEAQDHQDLPFERLVEELGPERELGRNPLFQVLVNLVPSSFDDVLLGPAVLTPCELETPFTRFDLGFTYTERARGLTATLEYRSDLYDPGTIERMLTRLEAILRVGASAPEVRLHELPLLTSAEERAVLAWGTNRDRAAPTTVLDLVAAQVEDGPDRAAVVSPDRPDLTYADLWWRSGVLADRIRSESGPGTTVGLLTSRDERLVVGALAAWRAGCSYLPLDAHHPEERRQYSLDDAGAGFVITDEVVDAALQAAHDAGGGPPADLPRVGPSDLAYLIYTSGSTGRPKGVEIEQQSVANLLRAMAQTVDFTRDDTIAAVTTFSFDMAVPEVWLPLVTGGRVALLPLEVSTDPDRLAEALQTYDVTVLQATPSRWRMLLADRWPGRPGLKALCGGEAISPDLADALRPLVGQLWNCYGPTETTVWSTMGRLEEPADVSVGRALLDTTVYVLDAQGRLVPPGTRGELWIGGGGVARGYHNRADLTAERFVPDPWQPGRRMYRTGDLAVWTPAGRLHCLGRTDAQVKLRGYRVELGEIEAVMTACAGVREAAAVLREDSPGDARLVGYVVGAPDGVLDALRATLPPYMVPTALVELDVLPRTTTNKIDRQALPAPVLTPTEGTPPTTDAELTVARIWSELLHVEGPHLEDDFFGLGGHSLLATRLTSRLSEAFGAQVALRTVFEHPTLGALAAAAQLGGAPGAGPTPVPRTGRRLDPADVDDRDALVAALDGRSDRADGAVVVWPMSTAQQRMWLLHELAPGDPSYHVSMLRRVRGPFDPDVLEDAVAALVARHDLLRTTYFQHDELLVQLVHDPAAMTPGLHRLDLRGAAWDDVLAAMRRESAAPFDLVSGPVLRVTVAQVDSEEWLLLVVQHHIAVDGWSLAGLLDDLKILYSGGALPTPALQFGDYVVWESARDESVRDAEYWRTALAGAPVESTFPSAVERHVETAPRGRRVRRALTNETVRRVDEIARARNATPFMVLVAAVSGLLARHGVGPDVVLGTPVATRSFAGGEQLSGPLINTLPLRLSAHGAHGFGEHLDDAARVCREAYAHQDYPFERLVSDLAVPRSPVRHPLFQVLVSLQEDGAGPAGFGEAAVETVEIDWHAARVDASFAWTLRPDRIDLVLEYREDRFTDEILGAWLGDRFERFLAAALADPDVPMAGLPCCGRDEQRTVASWADPAGADDAPLLPDLVRRVAADTPDLTAVEVAGSTLTFGALVAAADVLAGRLLEAGVARGDTVALFVGHDLVWPVAVLATWRLGAAWVPVDPTYPEARQALMVEDSGSVAVILPAGVAPAPSVGDRPVVVSDPVVDSGRAAPALPDHVVDPADPAYLIYTSGSTGTPKAARVAHGGLASLTAAVRSRFWGDLDPVGRRVGLMSAVIFDFSVLQLVNLGFAATLVLVPDDVRRDPRASVGFVEEAGIDVLDLTPTHLRVLLEEGLADHTRLERLLVGGEAVEQDLWDRLRAWSVPALNLYGPTEFTVCATAADISGSPTPTLGRPLPAVRVRIVDDAGLDRPVGVPGELWLGGRQVGDGYVNRPELTAERFPERDDGRWYRSGDLVAARSDGDLVFLGRIDDQVKVRGFRIEPGEVAEALRRRPSVADAVVVAEDGRLVAYVTVAAGSTWQPGELRHDLRAELPAHLVPAMLVEVAEIPFMANGKLDRAALRALPREVEAAAPSTGRPPSGPAEELVAEIWSDILGATAISADDDFFDLGGDSLSASRFVARLRSFDIDLPLLQVFAAPTLADVARPITDLLLAHVDAASTDGAP